MNREIVLGVGAGIAAYKSCELLRTLKEAGHLVTVVPTAASLNFVGRSTWEALSGRPVHSSLWENVDQVPHVHLGQQADLIVVAPATADLLARAAHGLADDLLTNTLLMATCPIVMAPAMHTEMWLNSAVQENVRVLRSRGVIVLEPASGRLTGSDSGPGRLPEPQEIASQIFGLLEHGSKRDLLGTSVVVTAGGTREAIDPVRFIGNRSSGLQGYAVARAAALRGADVTLIAANSALVDPAGVKVIHVESAQQMSDAVSQAAPASKVIVMAAAVSDFRPESVEGSKIKKQDGAPSLSLVKNDDILKRLVKDRADGQVIVGFAAETGDGTTSAREFAQAKLIDKGCDFLVFNDVSGDRVFGKHQTEATLFSSSGEGVDVKGSKDTLAHALLDMVAQRLA